MLGAEEGLLLNMRFNIHPLDRQLNRAENLISQFACWVFFILFVVCQSFLLIQMSFRNTIRVPNNLSPDQIRRFARRDLIRESPLQFENRIMARVYMRSIMRSTMYQKAPFC